MRVILGKVVEPIKNSYHGRRGSHHIDTPANGSFCEENSSWPFSASEFNHITSSVEAQYCGMLRDLHTATDRNHPIMFVWVVIVLHDSPVHT